MALAQVLESDSGSDALEFRSKRKLSDTAGLIDFAPLCDMTFQLLAFFIMTVSLAGQEMVDVPKVTHGRGVDLDTAIIFTIFKPLDPKSDAKMLAGNGSDGRPVTLDEARAAIEAGVNSGRGNVIIKAEREVPWGAVQRLARIVSSVSGAEFFVGVADKE